MRNAPGESLELSFATTATELSTTRLEAAAIGNARFGSSPFAAKRSCRYPRLDSRNSSFGAKTCNYAQILGTWQFSSKAVIWLCDGILCLARAVQRSRVVLSEGRTQARTSGGDGAAAPV